MKILILVDDFLPDSIKIAAKMMHELAMQFMKEGHEVTVMAPGKRELSTKEGNLRVIRYNAGRIKNTSKLRRAINESLLWVRALPIYFFDLRRDRHDMIIYYSPTIFFGPLVQLLKRTWKCPSYLILRDIFPQWAIDQKILKKKSLITSYFKLFEKINYAAADIIALQSPKNLEWFGTHFSTNKKLSVLYNWTNVLERDDLPEDSDKYRKKLKLEGKTVFFYGGNMGKAQDMMNLVRLAKNMVQNTNAHFIFVGLGDEVDLVKKAIIDYGLTNTTYLGAVDQSEYLLLLREFDVGLFSLHKSHESHNFPGKLLGYMQNGLPILGSVNPGNDVKELINSHSAGYISINGQDEELASYAQKLSNDPILRKKMGEAANQLLKSHFSVQHSTKKILEEIKEC
ncbi:MAG: glycosyltransferase family 4 protein [Muricauda sp.]|nr:glycosyltransferase family 4 protein [Allomuricauda sp.]